MNRLPTFAEIRDALLNAPPNAVGFPLPGLYDVTNRVLLRQQPHLQHILSRIAEESQRAETTPIPPLSLSLFRLFEVSGDRATYETAYFDRRRRLAALALAALFFDPVEDETGMESPPSPNGEGSGVRLLSDLLWEICGEYTWALPAHLPVGVDAVRANRLPPEQVVDLFAAETAMALAEVLSLLGNRLDPWLDLRIRQEVERRIFQSLFHNPVRFWWESAAMNWASVCAGGAGIAALVLVEDRERLAGMIDRVLRALESFLSVFPADGGTSEGIVYWEYGFGFFVYFAEALRAYTGGAIDLLDSDHVRRIAAFPNAVALGDNHFVNFSDANATVHLHAGLCARVSERIGVAMPPLPQPDFGTDHIFRWAHISRDVAWSKPRADTSLVDGTFYLPDLAWCIDRRTVGGQTIAFAVKGGHNDEPHNHNDLGHFILHVRGESLLADVGAGRYTRQYFGKQRYESIHNGAHGHSVPILDGFVQREGRQFAATASSHKQHADGVDFALDLTHAYALASLKSLQRTFTWRVDGEADSATLVLTDRMLAEKPVRLDQSFVSLHKPAQTGSSGEQFVWRGEHGEVTLLYDTIAFTPRLEETPSEDHFGTPITVYRLLLTAKEAFAEQEARFVFRCRLKATPGRESTRAI